VGKAQRAHHLSTERDGEMVGTLRFVVLSQKVARFDVENQLFEEIQV
jgi:hypothetical protein